MKCITFNNTDFVSVSQSYQPKCEGNIDGNIWHGITCDCITFVQLFLAKYIIIVLNGISNLINSFFSDYVYWFASKY